MHVDVPKIIHWITLLEQIAIENFKLLYNVKKKCKYRYRKRCRAACVAKYRNQSAFAWGRNGPTRAAHHALVLNQPLCLALFAVEDVHCFPCLPTEWCVPSAGGQRTGRL